MICTTAHSVSLPISGWCAVLCLFTSGKLSIRIRFQVRMAVKAASAASAVCCLPSYARAQGVLLEGLQLGVLGSIKLPQPPWPGDLAIGNMATISRTLHLPGAGFVCTVARPRCSTIVRSFAGVSRMTSAGSRLRPGEYRDGSLRFLHHSCKFGCPANDAGKAHVAFGNTKATSGVQGL